MSEQITESVKEAIKKHLSAEVSATLQEVLRKGEADALALEKANAQLVEQRVAIDARNRRVEFLEGELQKQDALDKREAAVTEREIKAEIFELKAQLEAAKKISTFSQEFLMIAVKNPILKENYYKTIGTQPNWDGNHQYHSPISESVNKTTEQVTE